MSYCMNDEDAEFLSKLNDGKDVNDEPRKDKLGQCSEDVFEEAMNYLEETTARLQPFASVESVSLPGLDEMERAIDDNLSADAQTWLKPIYQYWWSKKGSRSLMPSIKVRVLDTSNDADDADPYVCFRRREVRQTRKTRGRDAQVVEKLKKLRLELEQARQLVQLVVQREQLNKEDLEISRRVFEERKKLKDVKIDKNIIGEKGEDEELLVNQKVCLPATLLHHHFSNCFPQPAPKAKRPQEAGRPATIRLRSAGDRSAPEDELTQLADIQAQADAEVQRTIAARKEQHKRWNAQWEDETWRPLTPPLDDNDEKPRWAPLALPDASYPTPPPTLPSENSPDRDDVEMQDAAPIREEDASAGALPEPEFVFHIPGAYPQDEELYVEPKRDPTPLCRLRYGRGGRCWLEARRKRPYALISRGVVSDSESDDDEPAEFFPIDQHKVFDLRVGFMTGRVARPESMGGERRGWSSGDQAAVAGASGQQQQASQAQQQQTPAGSAG